MKTDPMKDGISSVGLLTHMGDDLMVVNAARVSMAKEHHEFEEMADTKLIRYLAKHKHWTPFSHPQVQLRIRMPIFVARQWFKHMIGFTRNEVSRRYVDDTPEFHLPNEWRKRAANVKQGSSEEIVVLPLWLAERVIDFYTQAESLYDALLEHEVCPEQARMVLPQLMYTEFIETGSLAAYARLAGLRLDGHAQKEIQWYAQSVDSILSNLFPVSWEALKGGAE